MSGTIEIPAAQPGSKYGEDLVGGASKIGNGESGAGRGLSPARQLIQPGMPGMGSRPHYAWNSSRCASADFGLHPGTPTPLDGSADAEPRDYLIASTGLGETKQSPTAPIIHEARSTGALNKGPSARRTPRRCRT